MLPKLLFCDLFPAALCLTNYNTQHSNRVVFPKEKKAFKETGTIRFYNQYLFIFCIFGIKLHPLIHLREIKD